MGASRSSRIRRRWSRAKCPIPASRIGCRRLERAISSKRGEDQGSLLLFQVTDGAMGVAAEAALRGLVDVADQVASPGAFETQVDEHRIDGVALAGVSTCEGEGL